MKKEDKVVVYSEEIKKLAVFIFFKEHEGLKQLEKEEEAVKQLWYKRAAMVLECIDKLNMVVINKKELESLKSKGKNVQEASLIIKNFIDGLKVFKKEYFPCEELAYKILGD